MILGHTLQKRSGYLNESMNSVPLFLLGFFLLATCFSCTSLPADESDKPRVIVSTDIGGTDPDDFQSMIHYLMYADRFETEGLIASPYGQGRKGDILRIIDLYEQDFPKLNRQADFPEPDFLRSITKQGAKSAASPKGWDEPSEGSEWIIQKAKSEKEQPLWVLVWGGLEDLAQALHGAPEIADKIKVYWIGGPNKKWSVHSYLYIARNFPDLSMIEANATYRGWFVEEQVLPGFGNKEFYEKSIKGKGALGTEFGKHYKGEIKMGDTPSVAYLLHGEAEQPAGESWGGSFKPLPYSAYRPFERHTDNTDTIPAFSLIEWTWKSEETESTNDSMGIWMEIDNQRIDGFYAGNNEFSVRFVPKRAANWQYTIHCTAPDLHAKSGEFISTSPWPGKTHPANITLNNWWTDKSEPATFLGEHQGARTISKWRQAFLSDWATRLDGLEE